MKIETGRFIRSAVSEADFVVDGLPQVAFVGRSNVGKSSLLNRLLGRRSLARISSTPGRTRAINYFLVNSGFYFVDLPGYGYAKVGKQIRREWARLMEAYFREAPRALRVVQLVDAKVGATPLDRDAADYFAGLEIATTVVATKIDKVSRGRQAKQLREIRSALQLDDDTTLVPFSAVKGDGVGELWREIETFLRDSPPSHQTARGTS
ncbi:MAG: ribosome biogenesis GTP-binding protein YihA/YsxC [Acidobacteriota bacterium]|nr:ribosome biogenesis GTP-binding protein YihA/YsxC [Acidobacteriota bacterium]